jgi:hypothetical protein
MGAYARRAAEQRGDVTPATARAMSVSMGSPYFIPGMPEGTPWTVVAEMPDGPPLVTPCGANVEHAHRVNRFRQAATARGDRPDGRSLPVGGHIVDPAGEIHERWSATELSSRADSAKLAG